jgi:hypothetical protein
MRVMWWTAPARGIEVPYSDRCANHMRGAVQMQVTTIGLDIAKNVFQVHGIDANEKVVVRVPGDRDHAFQVIVITHSRAS